MDECKAKTKEDKDLAGALLKGLCEIRVLIGKKAFIGNNKPKNAGVTRTNKMVEYIITGKPKPIFKKKK